METETSDVAVDEAVTPYVLRHRLIIDLADGTTLSVRDDPAGVYFAVFTRRPGPEVSFVLSSRHEESAVIDAIINSAAFSRSRVDQG